MKWKLDGSFGGYIENNDINREARVEETFLYSSFQRRRCPYNQECWKAKEIKFL